MAELSTKNELDEATLRTVLRTRSRELLRGRSLAGFVIEDELGRGGMGLVLKARHPRDPNSPVALKVLVEDAPNEALIERFRREARVLSELRHPGIVSLLGARFEGGIAYMAMELVPGETLEARIERGLREQGGPPPPHWSAQTLAGVAEALAYCHAQGLVHRDVKPGNILIQPTDGRPADGRPADGRPADGRPAADRPILIDFGLTKPDPGALATDSETLFKRLSTSGQILGTPAFLSPEQLDASGRFGQPGPGSDVWALGVTLFYALTGRYPHDSGSVVQQYVAILSQEPHRARHFDGDIPEALDAITAACLTRHSARRPTMTAVAAALRGECVLTPPAEPDQEATDERPKYTFHKPKSRWRPLILGSAVTFALLSIAALLTRPKAPLLEDLRAPKWSRTAEAELTGRIGGGPGTLSIQGRKVEPAPDGRFTARVKLEEGRNDLRVIVTGPGGRVERTVLVERDSIPPQIRVDGLTDGKLILVEDVTIRGRVRDDGPVTLRVNDNLTPLDARGFFEIAGEPLVDQQVLFIALDGAANKTEIKFICIRPPPPVPLKLDPQSLRKRFENGVQAYQSGRYREAQTIFNGHLLDCPSDAMAYFYRGASIISAGDHLAGIKDYDRALELDPGLKIVHYYRGIASYKLSDYERTISDLTIHLASKPTDATALRFRAWAKRGQGRFTEALSDLDAAIASGPGDIDSRMTRAQLLYNTQSFERAEGDLTKIIELAPDHGEAYYLRGTIKIDYRRRNIDYKSAAIDFQNAVRFKAPNVEMAHFHSGECFARVGDVKIAETELSAAIAIKVDYWEAYLERARLRVKGGKIDGAVADYQQALRIVPNNSAAKTEFEAIRSASGQR